MVSLVAMYSSQDASISHESEKRRNYDMSFKLEAIAVIAVVPTGKDSFAFSNVQTRLKGQYNEL